MIFVQAGDTAFGMVGGLISLMALIVAAIVAPWRQLINAQERQHAFAFVIVALALFWQLEVDVQGMWLLRPLLMMALVMVFGAPLAIVAASLALLLEQLLGDFQWSILGLSICFAVVVPVLTASGVLLLLERIPNRNLFHYMLGGGFFGAMITVQVMAACVYVYVWLLGPEPLLFSIRSHYYLSLLMMFPEGFMNGAIVTTVTVLKPELMKTYDDKFYLQRGK